MNKFAFLVLMPCLFSCAVIPYKKPVMNCNYSLINLRSLLLTTNIYNNIQFMKIKKNGVPCLLEVEQHTLESCHSKKR